jgi:homoserine kinase
VISISGDGGRLPREPDRNTAAVAAAGLLRSIDFPFGVEIALEKQMPLSSGLGSSAASAVAAVFATNELAGAPLGPREMLPFTMEAERAACGSAHADNVAPALFGGFVLIRSYDPLDVVRLPVPPGITCAIAHPHTELRTEDARRVLKKEIPLAAATRQWGNLAALVAALFSGDMPLLSRSLQDVVAEPARSLLIPGFDAVKVAAREAGALGCSISGSGPSVFALCVGEAQARAAGRAMVDAFARAGLASDLFVSAVNTKGPVVLSGKAGRGQGDRG